MKIIRLIIVFVALCLSLTSCLTEEGEGGSGTIQGYLFNVKHADDNYALTTDTVSAVKTDVYIIYGDHVYFDDDIETDYNGFYQFKYLTAGTYTIFAYSTDANGVKTAVTQTVTLTRGDKIEVSDMYVHSGQANGTSIISGTVWANYVDGSGNIIESGWAYEHRVYLQKSGDIYPIDDVRVGQNGVFAFQKVIPGSYEVYTTTIDENEIPTILKQNIIVSNSGEIYTLASQFIVTINP
jgi:hypothetical protein